MSTELRLSIASKLTTIVSLYRDLESEALHRYADKEYPGGEAMVMLGPVANLEAFNYRQLSELMGRTTGGMVFEGPDSDPAPPLLVLAGWSEVVATEKGDVRTQRATIEREAEYLRSNIDWMGSEDEYGEPVFLPIDELDRDLAGLEKRLEALLKAGTRLTHGAPCLHCPDKNLVRNEDAKYGLQDSYYCPGCKRTYEKDAYDYAVGTAHLAHATELTAVQIETRTGIKATRVRVWGSRHPELKTKRSPEGPWLYDVAAVQERDAALSETA
jgi:transposase-like protein